MKLAYQIFRVKFIERPPLALDSKALKEKAFEKLNELLSQYENCFVPNGLVDELSLDNESFFPMYKVFYGDRFAEVEIAFIKYWTPLPEDLDHIQKYPLFRA